MLPYQTSQTFSAFQPLCSHEAGAKGADRTTPETTAAVRKSAPDAKEDLTIHLTEFSSKLDDKSIPYGQ
jgi:hypothetical protein